MYKFEDEIKNEYPEWFDENDNDERKNRKMKRSKAHTPMYVLPVILTLLILGIYIGVFHIKQKQNLWGKEQAVSNLEEQVVKTNSRVSRNEKAINLVGILHNENFASVRQDTGNQEIVFINKNWTINKMPKYLNLSKETIEMIKDKYLNRKEEEQPTTNNLEPDEVDFSEE